MKHEKRTNPFTHPPVIQFADEEPLYSIYVIGPITGMDNQNREAFDSARARLEEAGYHALTPFDIIEPGTKWLHSIVTSLYVLEGVDGVASLEGSVASPGASIEAIAAMRLEKPIMSVDEWIAEAIDES